MSVPRSSTEREVLIHCGAVDEWTRAGFSLSLYHRERTSAMNENTSTSPGDTSAPTATSSLIDDQTPVGIFDSVARMFLGDSPGTRAFARGLTAVAAGVTLQMVGTWLLSVMPHEVVGVRLFGVVVAVCTAAITLLLVCGITTMLAGAIRYGVGATDR